MHRRPPLRLAELDAARLEEPPRLMLLGIDHRSAPVELRERVAYSAEEASELLGEMIAAGVIAEASLLSTCNRTEVYLRPEDDAAAYRRVLELAFLRRAPEIGSEGRFYAKHGVEVARHLLRVASGLESMVLGEPEILGQVKRAAALADRSGAGGPVLERLFSAATRGAARARSDTGIASGSVSFGYAVVDLARNIFQRLEDCAVVMIGAGETARQVARNLRDQGAEQLTVINRSRERAETFGKLFPESTVEPWHALVDTVAGADVVVASTSARGAILDERQLAPAMAERATRPLLIVDLGVPRNIEPAVGELANVFLQDIDSLEQLVQRNLKKRREEIPKVEEVLAVEHRRFERWVHGLAIEPVVATLQRRAEELRRDTVEAVRQRFPAETHEELERLTRTLVRRLLHHPSSSLREHGSQPGSPYGVHLADLVRRLFRLTDDGSGDPGSGSPTR